MFQITYPTLFVCITLAWIAVRASWAYRHQTIDWRRELRLLTLYVCMVVIARIVYFPWHHVDGQIAPLVFDASRVFPLWLNPVPLVRLFEVYDGWQRNLVGNIAMFIPVGIFLPFCFKELDTIKKVTLAGFGCSLFIEISQLPFFDRATDVDDLLLNTIGTFLGAAVYFGMVRLTKPLKNSN